MTDSHSTPTTRVLVAIDVAKAKHDVLVELFLYVAVPHGCQAGRHNRAFREVCWARIQQGQKFFAPSKLGTVSADLEVLSCFFLEDSSKSSNWKYPVASITGEWRALLFGQAGYRLWMLGSLQEAITPMEEAFKADVDRAKKAAQKDIEREAWKYASVDADTLANIHLSLSDLGEALSCSEEAVEYAKKSGSPDQCVSALSTQGDAQHQQGNLPESEKTFKRAKGIKGAGKQTFLFPLWVLITAWFGALAGLATGTSTPASAPPYESASRPSRLMMLAIPWVVSLPNDAFRNGASSSVVILTRASMCTRWIRSVSSSAIDASLSLLPLSCARKTFPLK